MAAASRSAMPVRTMFGRNELDRVVRTESKIGSGGGGVVYKAWHKRLQKYVVVKESGYGTNDDVKKRRNELEALKNVKCVYLPQVYDFLRKGRRSYTVMEYVEGESFDKLLMRGQKFTQAQVIMWYGELAAALETLHRRNICHRDIKPSNIMLTPDGDVCLIDFNAALVEGNNTRVASRSLGYASPEQYAYFESLEKARGAAGARKGQDAFKRACKDAETPEPDGDDDTVMLTRDGFRESADKEDPGIQMPGIISLTATDTDGWKLSDIYSLGATVYHLLTGERPPAGTADMAAIPERGQYNNDIALIIEKSMQIMPSERFASAAELACSIRDVSVATEGNLS